MPDAEPRRERFVYVTAITTDSYLVGALAVMACIKRSGTPHGQFAIVTGDVSAHSKDVLRSQGIGVIDVESPSVPIGLNKEGDHPHWGNTFAKLLLFSLERFDKVLYVDSDMLILDNIDELFLEPHMSAVQAGRSVPGNELWTGLNSGLMVLRPERGLSEALVNSIPAVAECRREIGDQDVLQAWYDWPRSDEQIINETYNIFASSVDYYINNKIDSLRDRRVKVVHFAGSPKPWAMSVLDQGKHIARLLRCGRKYEAAYFLRYLSLIGATRLRMRNRSWWRRQRSA